MSKTLSKKIDSSVPIQPPLNIFLLILKLLRVNLCNLVIPQFLVSLRCVFMVAHEKLYRYIFFAASYYKTSIILLSIPFFLCWGCLQQATSQSSELIPLRISWEEGSTRASLRPSFFLWDETSRNGKFPPRGRGQWRVCRNSLWTKWLSFIFHFIDWKSRRKGLFWTIPFPKVY